MMPASIPFPEPPPGSLWAFESALIWPSSALIDTYSDPEQQRLDSIKNNDVFVVLKVLGGGVVLIVHRGRRVRIDQKHLLACTQVV